MVLWGPTRSSGTNIQKKKKGCAFHHMGLEWKGRKSRDTWSNRQIWPWSTKWRRAKANSVLPRECTGHSKHPLPTTQQKTLHMDITRWLILKSDWLYALQPKRSSMLLLLLSCFSCVWLCATPWTAAYQASPSMGFSRQEHWRGLPFPSPMHESAKGKWSRSVVSNS